MTAYNHPLVELVKDKLTGDELQQFFILLDEFDTAAKRNIVEYMRKQT